MTEEIKSLDFTDRKLEEKLSKCEDVILKTKRLILKEQLDKIANYTLSDITTQRKTLDTFPRVCKRRLDLREESFWGHIPCPGKDLGESNQVHTNNEHGKQVQLIISEVLHINTNKTLPCQRTKTLRPENECLLNKYFNLWKEVIETRKNKRIYLEEKIEQKVKLDQFIKKLKKQKKLECLQNEKKEDEYIEMSISPKTPRNYTNRYKAQKTIIEMQKSKLEQQNKIINELKLGIIREDLLKSIESTKINIREIFSTCSQKVKSTAPFNLLEDVPRLSVSTGKAPKIARQMEERALQRAQKRQIILERKRLIEEARQKMLEEAIERKIVMEEEDRKRNLEVIKERRRKELELEKVRQANKQKYLDNLDKAIRFHRNLVLSQSFKKLYKYLSNFKENNLLAKKHYENKMLRKSLQLWEDYIENLYTPKYIIANAHFVNKSLKKCFNNWKWRYMENYRNIQVAEDYYDFRLTSNTFIHWHRYVCRKIMIDSSKIKAAQEHYERKILFQYFYQWRSLKTVLELEKTKELKKRRWREKVWEILPDYKPPEDIFY